MLWLANFSCFNDTAEGGGKDAATHTQHRRISDAGDDIKIVFLGGSNNHLRIMVDAPKEVDIVRSKVLEKAHPEIKEKHPKYYAEPDLPERYRKKKGETK